jgi:hypothetical protein
MRRKPANLVPELGVLRRANGRAVALLSVLHIVVNQNAELIACVVKGIRQKHSSPPNCSMQNGVRIQFSRSAGSNYPHMQR